MPGTSKPADAAELPGTVVRSYAQSTLLAVLARQRLGLLMIASRPCSGGLRRSRRPRPTGHGPIQLAGGIARAPVTCQLTKPRRRWTPPNSAPPLPLPTRAAVIDGQEHQTGNRAGDR